MASNGAASSAQQGPLSIFTATIDHKSNMSGMGEMVRAFLHHQKLLPSADAQARLKTGNYMLLLGFHSKISSRMSSVLEQVDSTIIFKVSDFEFGIEEEGCEDISFIHPHASRRFSILMFNMHNITLQQAVHKACEMWEWGQPVLMIDTQSVEAAEETNAEQAFGDAERSSVLTALSAVQKSRAAALVLVSTCAATCIMPDAHTGSQVECKVESTLHKQNLRDFFGAKHHRCILLPDGMLIFKDGEEEMYYVNANCAVSDGWDAMTSARQPEVFEIMQGMIEQETVDPEEMKRIVTTTCLCDVQQKKDAQNAREYAAYNKRLEKHARQMAAGVLIATWRKQLPMKRARDGEGSEDWCKECSVDWCEERVRKLTEAAYQRGDEADKGDGEALADQDLGDEVDMEVGGALADKDLEDKAEKGAAKKGAKGKEVEAEREVGEQANGDDALGEPEPEQDNLRERLADLVAAAPGLQRQAQSLINTLQAFIGSVDDILALL